MLSFQNVSRIYPTSGIALDDVTFDIADEEFVFLVGPSGAGKSTIIRLMIQQERPDKGSIVFDEIDITSLKKNRLAQFRRDIGVVFQDFKLLPGKTIRENVAFVLEVAGKSKTDINKAVDYTLDLVGIIDKSHNFPDELSGGEQQRAAIARAIINEPKLLIADEPTGNLDRPNAWDIVQLLNKINNMGTTVIVATHDTEIVDSLQKRVLALEDGKVIRDSVGGYHNHANTPHKKA